jgi:hypothetical protein
MIADVMARDGRDEVETVWEKSGCGLIGVLSRRLPRGMDENRQDSRCVSQPRFEPRPSRI